MMENSEIVHNLIYGQTHTPFEPVCPSPVYVIFHDKNYLGSTCLCKARTVVTTWHLFSTMFLEPSLRISPGHDPKVQLPRCALTPAFRISNNPATSFPLCHLFLLTPEILPSIWKSLSRSTSELPPQYPLVLPPSGDNMGHGSVYSYAQGDLPVYCCLLAEFYPYLLLL